LDSPIDRDVRSQPIHNGTFLFIYTGYPVPCANATPRGYPACGSMVLTILSVVRFSPCERKTNNKKKIKYRCE